MIFPEHGELWQHVRTGGVYAIVSVGLDEETFAPVVTYRPLKANAGDGTWTRRQRVFMDGRFVRRRDLEPDHPVDEWNYGVRIAVAALPAGHPVRAAVERLRVSSESEVAMLTINDGA